MNLETLHKGQRVDVSGIPMVVSYMGRHGQEIVALATEDGLGVDWDLACPGEDLGDNDELLCVDLVSGEKYWVCVYCRGVSAPQRRGAHA